jgi:hypothetical protein
MQPQPTAERMHPYVWTTRTRLIYSTCGKCRHWSVIMNKYCICIFTALFIVTNKDAVTTILVIKCRQPTFVQRKRLQDIKCLFGVKHHGILHKVKYSSVLVQVFFSLQGLYTKIQAIVLTYLYLKVFNYHHSVSESTHFVTA